jgi:hypothetical protein
MDIEYQIIDYQAKIFNIVPPIYKSDNHDDKTDIFKSLLYKEKYLRNMKDQNK